MPKLLIFAPCEKVIISTDDNNPTLIAILSEINGEIESPKPLDRNAVGPMRWSFFSLWQQEDGDENKIFEQTFRLVSPSGRRAIESTVDLILTARTHRTVAKIGAVPIGENGEWTIQLFEYEKGQTVPAEPVATYPIQIRFNVTVKADNQNL